MTVAFSTADSTAIAGSDDQATSGTLSFALGETTETISVPASAIPSTRPTGCSRST